jgi:hypothetical protein
MSHRSALRRTFAPALLVMVAVAACAAARSSNADETRFFAELEVPGGSIRYVGGIPVATFSGSPEEIGRQHAELLAESSKAAIGYPKRFAARFGLEKLWPLAMQAGRSMMLNAPKRHQQELAAIAAQAKLNDGDLAVANTLLELRRVGCSTLIVEPQRSATGGPLLGRNFDFPTLGELHRYSIVMVYRPEGRRAFVAVGFPGMVGLISGMNDAGLTLVTLDVEQSADGSRQFDPTGTPLACVFRRILEECATVDEAEELLRSEKRTTWMNLAVCDREDGAVFEITPKTVARRDDENHLVLCTNHFRAAELCVDKKCWRYEELVERAATPQFDLEAVHKGLDAVNQGDNTLQTMIFEPRELVLHVAFGEPPVSDDALTTIDLAPLFAGEREAAPAAAK